MGSTGEAPAFAGRKGQFEDRLGDLRMQQGFDGPSSRPRVTKHLLVEL